MRLKSPPEILVAQLVFLAAQCVSAKTATEIVDKRETAPSPIVIAPSQNWDGNDGSWSSFPFQVGNPAQNVRLFVATASHQTVVVLPEGCIASDPSNCADLRGGEYHTNASSTWFKNTANLTTNIYPLQMGQQLGYTGRAALGSDDITLGWQGAGGPTVKNQTVAGIATKDTYLGLFGLTPRASNFTSFNNPIPSLVQNLKSQSLIPSLSWAYTAGNQYRLSQVLGSLTLGGYDRSRFVAHDITWGFNSQDIRDLTVQITSITSSTKSSEASLLPSSIPAFLDSSLPYIWLPQEACALFEKAFNLTWDTKTELYLLTDSQHKALASQNPNITFTLGNLTEGVAVNITLPYAAFDLMAKAPLVSNATRYFPLKRADNFTQYTLGRTFFQEAYVIADYDRGNFSVSQCSWVPNAQQDIVAIAAPSTSSPSSTGNGTTTTGDKSKSSTSVPAGAVVGGVVGGVAVLAAVSFLIYHFCIKPRRRKAEAAAAATVAVEEKPPTPPQDPEAPSDDPTYVKPELDTQPITTRWEMEGGKNVHPEREGGVAEVDGHSAQVHELPAREEVAAELMGQRDIAVEMAGSTHQERNPRFSWQNTPVEMHSSRGRIPATPRWSWVTSPGGDTLYGSSEKDPSSPQSGSATLSPQSGSATLSSQSGSAILSPQSGSRTLSPHSDSETAVSEPSPQSSRAWMRRVPE
ncbi:uncharacterized protein BP5553_01480 [Venustampulla echinocandica]|uniref:Peptidase A1 domain-containing protein n=1 Tax=Venustampulla echinocandica TaxID=2656787 RepID=A0A370U150_9HELO|nr:uncharacterized protein BP5553_01480 [Venustampulla echinocandica]RDL41501.1 hypothetical protein BP5553_01480 [Venustampulla echinocandica]